MDSTPEESTENVPLVSQKDPAPNDPPENGRKTRQSTRKAGMTSDNLPIAPEATKDPKAAMKGKGKKGKKSTKGDNDDIEVKEGELEVKSEAKGLTVWTEKDTSTLLQYLRVHKSKAGDNASYTMAVFNGAAAECNKVLTHGAAKTRLSCKNKFTKVRNRVLSF